jgi:hypothetical protein
MHTLHCSFIFVTTVGCIVALTTSLPADSMTGRDELDTLLVRHDQEADGPVKETLAARIDAIAHQKYATVSRLYWHVDLESAKAAAREQQRPILHLRMLGNLEQDLSCANSRLFRATLYANQDLSEFLRERFVLYWSSERPVPRVTIDYGDGRTLERTTAGNSAHYVLDEEGHVLDVLPGLYAPTAFRHELEGSLTLVAQVRDKSDAERASLIADYHRQLVVAVARDWERLAATPGMPDRRRLATQTRSQTSVAAAERATIAKAAVELKDLRLFAKELALEPLGDDQIRMWAAAGRTLYVPVGANWPALPGEVLASARVLDEASHALIIRLHDATPPALRSTDEDLRAMVARLEETIVADTALNQLQLRPQISREIVRRGGRMDFATLNAWIYAQVFHTPREDAWLGLLPRDVFTGLPGDGVVLRGAR